MGHAIRIIAAGAAALALQGCLARTAVSAVTLPVKVASSAVDLATTSQSEADQKRGREIRRREERLGELQRDYERNIKKCGDGEVKAKFTINPAGRVKDVKVDEADEKTSECVSMRISRVRFPPPDKATNVTRTFDLGDAG